METRSDMIVQRTNFYTNTLSTSTKRYWYPAQKFPLMQGFKPIIHQCKALSHKMHIHGTSQTFTQKRLTETLSTFIVLSPTYPYIYPEPKIQTKPNQKIRFGSGLNHINYTSESYIFGTKKSEPNQNRSENRMDTRISIIQFIYM